MNNNVTRLSFPFKFPSSGVKMNNNRVRKCCQAGVG